MKKYLFLFIGLLGLLYLNIDQVKAATYIDPVEFSIDDEFYLTIQKHYQDNITYFDIENSLGAEELTREQLKEILARQTTENQEYLTIYSKLNIKVTPLADTVFESLQNKDYYYLSIAPEMWVYEEVETNIEPNTEATKVNFSETIDLYSGGIIYKSPTDDEWTTNIPSDINLEGLTLEEQLATLLNLDLGANEKAVLEAYPDRYSIYGISSGTNNIKRFDFYNAGNNPTLNSSGTAYKTNSLSYLDNRYVVINYQAPAQTTFQATDIATQTEASNTALALIVLLLMSSAIATVIYLKKKQI